MGIKFTIMPISGESILITTPTFTMLIDGGRKMDSTILKEKLSSLGSPIDLVVLTHTDADHIGGLIKILSDNDCPIINEIWFNTIDRINIFPIKNKASNNTSYKDGNTFSNLIQHKKIKHENNITVEDWANEIKLSDNLYINILSPTKEHLNIFFDKWNSSIYKKINNKTSSASNDYHETLNSLKSVPLDIDRSIPNGSSIAFILRYKNSKFLFSGDAYHHVLVNSLENLSYSQKNPLNIDLFKLPHHGSSFNVSRELLRIVRTDKYMMCCKGWKNLPHKKTIAHILDTNEKQPVKFFSNKDLKSIFLKNEANPNAFKLIKTEEICFD